MVEYLHANLSREITAAEATRIAGVSRFNLTREFSRVLGLPVHAYHLHLRLEAGKRQLGSRHSIADVAAQLDFCDQSHFHRPLQGRLRHVARAVAPRPDRPPIVLTAQRSKTSPAGAFMLEA